MKGQFDIATSTAIATAADITVLLCSSSSPVTIVIISTIILMRIRIVIDSVAAVTHHHQVRHVSIYLFHGFCACCNRSSTYSCFKIPGIKEHLQLPFHFLSFCRGEKFVFMTIGAVVLLLSVLSSYCSCFFLVLVFLLLLRNIILISYLEDH